MTERPAVMSGVAYIPFSKIVEFAQYYDLSEDETDFLIEYIGHLDRWQIDQAHKKQASPASDK